jgi:cell division protein FtsB
MTKALNIKIIWLPTIILSLFLLVFYILQVGALSKDIYLLGSYERKLAQLSENNNFLDVSFSKMNSLSNIDEYLAVSDFIKTNKVKYIQILDNSVVANNR